MIAVKKYKQFVNQMALQFYNSSEENWIQTPKQIFGSTENWIIWEGNIEGDKWQLFVLICFVNDAANNTIKTFS